MRPIYATDTIIKSRFIQELFAISFRLLFLIISFIEENDESVTDTSLLSMSNKFLKASTSESAKVFAPDLWILTSPDSKVRVGINLRVQH